MHTCGPRAAGLSAAPRATPASTPTSVHSSSGSCVVGQKGGTRGRGLHEEVRARCCTVHQRRLRPSGSLSIHGWHSQGAFAGQPLIRTCHSSAAAGLLAGKDPCSPLTCIRQVRQEEGPPRCGESSGRSCCAGSRPAALSCGLPSSSPSACASLQRGAWHMNIATGDRKQHPRSTTACMKSNRLHTGPPTSGRGPSWRHAGGRHAALEAQLHRLHRPSAPPRCRRCQGGGGALRLETGRARWRRWRRRRAAGCRCRRSCGRGVLEINP